MIVLLRVRLRIHEWLADHISWVQYPRAKPPQQTHPSVLDQYRALTRKQRAWIWFAAFWGAIAALIQIAPRD